MEDRVKWLKDWLKERNYDIGDYRNTYLYIYYSTIRVLYSKQLCHDLLHRVNASFKYPLPVDNVDTIVSNVERKSVPSRYRNQDIIAKLGITEREEEILQIGHNQTVIQERARKKELKQQWYEDIIAVTKPMKFNAVPTTEKILASASFLVTLSVGSIPFSK